MHADAERRSGLRILCLHRKTRGRGDGCGLHRLQAVVWRGGHGALRFDRAGNDDDLGALAVNLGELPLIGSPPEDGIFGLANSIADSLIGGTYVIRGEGAFSLEFGWCPVCVELSRSIGLTWTMSFPEASLGIDFEAL